MPTSPAGSSCSSPSRWSPSRGSWSRADALVVAAILPAVMLLAGTTALRGEGRRPVTSLLVPAVLTGGAAAALQLVPGGLALVPAIVLFAIGIDRVLALEIRLLGERTSTTESDRARVLAAAVVTAFVAFTGVAALVPGGLPEPGATGPGTSLTEGSLLLLALGDALVALALGYRVAAARYGTVRSAAGPRSRTRSSSRSPRGPSARSTSRGSSARPR